MSFTTLNTLDQALDIAGSLTQNQLMIAEDEPFGFGSPITGQGGLAANITTVTSGVATITGLTGMSTNSIGRFLTINLAASSGNNGTFLIIALNSSSSVDISNISAVGSDVNNGSIGWVERWPYRLEDDINYIRSDRKLIKGTTNWYDGVPTYTRPTATDTNISANLTNIAGKTTDAVAYVVNRAFYGQSLLASDSIVNVTSIPNMKHSDFIDRTGVPCFDTGPFAGDYESCYVHIVDGYTDGYAGNELVVLSGVNKGERIFGISYAGSSTSPNNFELRLFSAPFGANFATSATSYTWEVGQPELVNLLYGYNERLDQLDPSAFRTVPALGILTDATLTNRVNNLYTSIGISDGYNNLLGYLTNTVANFPFFNLPDATPSVVEALNTLNAQVGDRTYSGAVLTSGQTIAASLQALSDAMGSSSITRIIERLDSDVTANTSHTLPGSASYTVDGTDNGIGMWVFTRGVLRDPGSVAGGNYYEETDGTSITFYSIQKAGDHINYFISS